jgi:IS1 family transposase/transposase-like protein
MLWFRVSVHVVVLGLLWLLMTGAYEPDGWAEQRRGPKRATGEARVLKARSPQDCGLCCEASEPQVVAKRAEVVAWSAHKSAAGRPKEYASEGLCCPNPACVYFNITDSRVHALTRAGQRGTRHDIPQWHCEACGTSFSARRQTAVHHLKTSPERVAEVMTALGEGVDVAAASRIFGHHPTTIRRWLERGAEHGQRLHQHTLRNLLVGHIQFDELVTRMRSQAERVWLWTAIEARSKLWLAFHLGRRTQQDAHAVVHQVKHELDPQCVPVCTSDGLNHYFYALTAHFGQWQTVAGQSQPVWQVASTLLVQPSVAGQFRKIRSGYKLKYTCSRMLLGTRDVMTQALQALQFSGRITTAYVERHNLTLRALIAPLRRRTWSLAHNQASLAMYVEWGQVYYNFVRYHQTLRLPTHSGQRARSRTPAMAAGLTHRRWTVHDLLCRPVPLLVQ